MQLFDLPADLCAHADELDRADFAGGVDGSGNVSDRHKNFVRSAIPSP